jgi:cytochrome c oxidase cbb3-type subunit 3
MPEKDKKNNNDQLKHPEHEWDGITENDSPEPSWLRVAFYITVFFALGYWILFPSWPAPNDKGVLNWSSVSQLEDDAKDINKLKDKYQISFDKASFPEIMKDPKLLHFAMISGRSTFQNNCAVCHGAGGGGNPGYPNLTAGAWMWGGKIDDIYQTLLHGIRSADPDAHDSQMPAFGKDKLLPEEDVKLMAHYAIYLAKTVDERSKDKDIDLKRADEIFQANCASCHGADAKGNNVIGAPNLTDAIWLYGGDYETVYDVIYHGRGGVMPYWQGKLTDSAIRGVAVYVHQLGGGK